MPWSWITKPYVFAALASATGLIFMPKSVTPIIYRSPAGPPMAIHSSHAEPPKKAFDDLFVSPKMTPAPEKEIQTTNLNSSAAENKNWNPLIAVKQHRVVLPTVSFNRQMVEADTASEVVQDREDTSWQDGLTKEQKARLDAANEKHDVLAQNWNVPGWRDFAAQKISNEQKNYRRQAIAANRVIVSSPSPGGARATPDVLHTAGVELRDQAAPPGTEIRGTVRLAPGLALGDRLLEVRRFVEGIPQESGFVNPKAGTFSIKTEALQGSIGIELFDKNGAIVASGSHRLTEEDNGVPFEVSVVAKNQFAGNFVNFDRNPARLITNKVTSTRGQPADVLYASLGINESTDALGSFAFRKVSESSFGLVRAQAPGFREGLYLLGAGEGQSLSLMPTSLITALENLTHEGDPTDLEEKNQGLVWGQVLFDGKPMSGVSISIEQDPSFEPTYLSGFIPVKTLQATTENGYFVFPSLATGMHSLMATRNGEYVGHVNVQVDEGAVSIGVIEATTKVQSVAVKVYDAFDGSPQEASLQMQSLTQGVDVLGQADVSLPVVHRLSLGYVQPLALDYLPAQFIYNDANDYVHIPLLRAAWLEQIEGQRRISLEPNTGTVVGFVPEDDFEAFLSHEDNYDTANIVYFNEHGSPVEKGVAGGGFVMFNVPISTQSIVVLSKKTEMLASQVIPVDANSNTLIKFRF